MLWSSLLGSVLPQTKNGGKVRDQEAQIVSYVKTPYRIRYRLRWEKSGELGKWGYLSRTTDDLIDLNMTTCTIQKEKDNLTSPSDFYLIVWVLCKQAHVSQHDPQREALVYCIYYFPFFVNSPYLIDKYDDLACYLFITCQRSHFSEELRLIADIVS